MKLLQPLRLSRQHFESREMESFSRGKRILQLSLQTTKRQNTQAKVKHPSTSTPKKAGDTSSNVDVSTEGLDDIVSDIGNHSIDGVPDISFLP